MGKRKNTDLDADISCHSYTIDVDDSIRPRRSVLREALELSLWPCLSASSTHFDRRPTRLNNVSFSKSLRSWLGEINARSLWLVTESRLPQVMDTTQRESIAATAVALHPNYYDSGGIYFMQDVLLRNRCTRKIFITSWGVDRALTHIPRPSSIRSTRQSNLN